MTEKQRVALPQEHRRLLEQELAEAQEAIRLMVPAVRQLNRDLGLPDHLSALAMPAVLAAMREGAD